MTDYIFILFAFLTIVTIFAFLVKYILNPLFFPDYFPEKEVMLFLEGKDLKIYKYEKLKTSLSKEFEKFPFYMISYFRVEVIDNRLKKSIIKVKKLKSGSFFYKNKIEFDFE